MLQKKSCRACGTNMTATAVVDTTVVPVEKAGHAH
jgi:hypothetical protein